MSTDTRPLSSATHDAVASTRLPAADPRVVFRAMPDGGVLFAPSTETYYGLNPAGAFVWEHLAPVCQTVDVLCTLLVERFPDAPVEQARQDVMVLLDDLLAQKLVTAV